MATRYEIFVRRHPALEHYKPRPMQLKKRQIHTNMALDEGLGPKTA
jgi:hypothetical protein